MQVDFSFLAKSLECVNVSATSLSEIKIGTFDKCLGCEFTVDDCLKKHLGREFQQLPIRRVGDHRVNTQFGEQHRFSFWPGEGRWRLLWTQYLYWVGRERKDHCGAPDTVRLASQFPEDSCMAMMDPIEVADGNGTEAEFAQARF